MLVLDALMDHTSEVVNRFAFLNADLQAIYMVINKPFIDHLRNLYSGFAFCLEAALTSVGKIKKPSVGLLYQWILTSWERIFPESVISGCKKCCLSNAMDKSEDDMILQNCAKESNSDNEIHNGSADHSNSKELSGSEKN
jgi:hypothetical protein